MMPEHILVVSAHLLIFYRYLWIGYKSEYG